LDGSSREKLTIEGHGSAKSATFATMLLLKGIEDPAVTLCTREIQSSIRDSVHAEIEQQINFHGLRGFHETGEEYVRGRRGTAAYGTDFIYRGLLRTGSHSFW
jgi:phage terminase large subunit